MTDNLTNEAAWLTAVNIIRRLGGQIDANRNPDVLNIIFEQVKAGLVVHHFLAQGPRPESQSTPVPSQN